MWPLHFYGLLLSPSAVFYVLLFIGRDKFYQLPGFLFKIAVSAAIFSDSAPSFNISARMFCIILYTAFTSGIYVFLLANTPLFSFCAQPVCAQAIHLWNQQFINIFAGKCNRKMFYDCFKSNWLFFLDKIINRAKLTLFCRQFF